jgi:hypothetical protein
MGQSLGKRGYLFGGLFTAFAPLWEVPVDGRNFPAEIGPFSGKFPPDLI